MPRSSRDVISGMPASHFSLLPEPFKRINMIVNGNGTNPAVFPNSLISALMGKTPLALAIKELVAVNSGSGQGIQNFVSSQRD